VDEGQGKRWLKYGCAGCAGVVLLAVLVVAVLALAARLQMQNDKPERRELSRAIEAPAPPAVAQPTVAVTRVVLDLEHADFQVAAGRPGEPLHVDATYDPQSYELQEAHDETSVPATYRVGFRRTGSWLMATVKEMLGGPKPKVRISLPPDAPLALDLAVSSGGAEIDLGGLWLTAADLRIDKGGASLSIGEPTREPLERLSIHAAMGGLAAAHLGNASPRRLDLDLAMGGTSLDLRGAWVRDAEISIDTRMSGLAVRLPRDVAIVGLENQGFAPAAVPELPPATLRFTVKTDGRGELRFSD